MNRPLEHFTEKDLLELSGQFKGVFYKNQLFITEEMELMNGYFQYPTRLDIYMLIICVQGSFDVSVNLQEFTVKEGMAMAYAPECVLQMRHSRNAVLRAIAITESFLHEIRLDPNKGFSPLINCKEKPIWQLTKKELKIINNYFRLIRSVYILHDETFQKEMIRGLISSVIFLFANVWKRESKAAKIMEAPGDMGARHLTRFMELLHKYHCREHQVGFYANKMCITPKHLSSLIKEHSGKSAAEWIDEYLILEAKSMLKFTDKSIKEIANELCFSDPSYFCKYFRNLTGLTPTGYKKQ